MRENIKTELFRCQHPDAERKNLLQAPWSTLAAVGCDAGREKLGAYFGEHGVL